MRQLILLGAALLVWPAAAYGQPRNDVHGFGGVTVGTSTFGSAASPTFGGRVGIGLTDHVQVVGEAGRLADISSPRFEVLGFDDVRVRVSAFYGEGGVRVAASPQATVRPYAEATAGFARLSASVSGLDDNAEAIINALDALHSTQPILGVGGGILLQAGPVSLDIGYRYKKIVAGDDIFGELNEGKGYHVNQVRVGVGFRF
jgi:opacity protein-like surface antigen